MVFKQVVVEYKCRISTIESMRQYNWWVWKSQQ